jgi:hypothetical protein
MRKVRPDDWSNIVYVIGGIFLYQNPALALSMLFLGFTSFMGHWKGGNWWTWDWAGMFNVFSAITLHNFGLSPLLSIPITYLGYKYGVEEYMAFTGLFVVSIISAYLADVAIWLPLGLFAIAFACQRYAEAARDHNDVRFQIFHSLWHLITMPAIVLLCS